MENFEGDVFGFEGGFGGWREIDLDCVAKTHVFAWAGAGLIVHGDPFVLDDLFDIRTRGVFDSSCQKHVKAQTLMLVVHGIFNKRIILGLGDGHDGGTGWIFNKIGQGALSGPAQEEVALRAARCCWSLGERWPWPISGGVSRSVFRNASSL